MSKLFEKAHLYQTKEHRRNFVVSVFLNRFIHKDGMLARDAAWEAEKFVDALDEEDLDMWYAQLLLEDAANEFKLD